MVDDALLPTGETTEVTVVEILKSTTRTVSIALRERVPLTPVTVTV